MNRRATVIGLAVCMFVSSMGWMIMQFPDILMMVTDIGHDVDSKWVLSMYIIAEVTVLPAAGKLTDVYGPRKVLTAGAAVFVIGALLCAVTGTESMLVAMRTVQGIGAGTVFAVVLASVGRMYPRSERGHPHEVMTAAFAFGSLYGAMIGWWFVMDSGFGIDPGWRYTFCLEAALMLVGWAVAMRGLPEQDARRTGGHDILGTALVAALIADLMVMSQLVNDEMELVSIGTGAMVLAALILSFAVGYVERRADDPVLPRRMGMTKVGSMACMFMAGFCGLGMVQFLMRFMLLGIGVSIYEASLTFLFLLAGGGITSMIGLKKVNSTGVRPWVMIGAVIVMIGFAVASQTLMLGMNYVRLSLFIIGLGLGCMVTEILCSIQGTTKVTDMGSVTAVTMSSRFIGILLGVASYTAILDHRVSAVVGSIGDGIGSNGILWLVENYLVLHDEVVEVFESSVELCCLVAGILCAVILAIAYLMVGRDDVVPHEFIGKDGSGFDDGPEEED